MSEAHQGAQHGRASEREVKGATRTSLMFPSELVMLTALMERRSESPDVPMGTQSFVLGSVVKWGIVYSAVMNPAPKP